MQVSRVLSSGLGAGCILSTTLLGDFRYIFSFSVSIVAFLSHPGIPQVLWGRDHLSLCGYSVSGTMGICSSLCYFFSIIFMRGLTHSNTRIRGVDGVKTGASA